MAYKTQIERRSYNAARNANQAAAKYECLGRVTATQVRTILERNVCYYCGKQYREEYNTGRGPSADTFGIDHVIPLSLGGYNTVANIVLACHDCNIRKFLSDKPGRWSPKHRLDACAECGLTEYKHEANGLCLRCHRRKYEREHPNRKKAMSNG